MIYDFDRPIDRGSTNAMSVHGYRDYLFGDRDDVDIPFADEELISIWVADMEFRTSDAILQAMHERIEHGIFGYTMNFDNRAKNAFVDWVASRYGHTFSTDHIVESTGIVGALKALAGYCKPDEKILILTPSYAYFKHAATFQNIEIVCSTLIHKDGEYFIDLDDIRDKVSDPAVTMTFFCSPHNPTGRIWTDDELRAYGEICLANGVTIVSDEIHCDLTRTGRSFTPMAKLFPDSEDVITCMAPSKTFNLASLKSAYVVIPNIAMRQHWIDMHSPILHSVSLAATEAAYRSGGEWLTQLRVYLDANFVFLQDYLSAHLPLAKFKIPDATYLAWVDLSAYLDRIDEEATYYFASRAGVLIEGGKMFVDNAEGFVRLNIACHRARLKEALDRICSVL